MLEIIKSCIHQGLVLKAPETEPSREGDEEEDHEEADDWRFDASNGELRIHARKLYIALQEVWNRGRVTDCAATLKATGHGQHVGLENSK